MDESICKVENEELRVDNKHTHGIKVTFLISMFGCVENTTNAHANSTVSIVVEGTRFSHIIVEMKLWKAQGFHKTTSAIFGGDRTVGSCDTQKRALLVPFV